MAASVEAPCASVTSSRSPPTRSLSSSEVPSAITWPWSITAIRSASRSASSRYWVVSSTVVPAATRASIVSHSDSRLRGSSPVVGSSRKMTGGRATSAAGEVEAPAHAARVGLGEPAARIRELEALEQLIRSLARVAAAHVVEPADHLEVLASGQVLVDRRVLTGEADLRAKLGRVLHDVEPGDTRRARRPAAAG